MSRHYSRRRTGWIKPWEVSQGVAIVPLSDGMSGILDIFKPKPPVPPLLPGQAPPGQNVINRMFGATPENPVRLPFQPIETSIEFSPKGTAVLLGTAGVFAAGMIFAALIKR